MKSNKSVGLILFTTLTIAIICLNSANKMSKTNFLRSNINTKKSKKMITLSETSRLNSGILIQLSSVDYPRNEWKYLVSIDYNNEDSSVECELEITNDFEETILFCWVSNDGILHNFHPIDDGSIIDGSVSKVHTEFTQIGHSFVCLRKSDIYKPTTVQEITKNTFLFLYQPSKALHKHKIIIKPNKHSNNKEPIVLVEAIDLSDDEVIDTTSKLYIPSTICGFSVLAEPDVFTNIPDLENALTEDLSVVRQLFPQNILRRVQTDTCIWINESITYGTKSKPIIGKSCTYHPSDGQTWLKRMGMNVNKAGTIEMLSANEYIKSRIHWSVGGILVHELSHCIHDKYLDNGFNNKIIQDCYSTAMTSKLYHSVHVHGPQGKDGKKAKAYACTNCMEFFAELSVAYLYNIDDTEYNKWFPHNRQQLMDYDLNSFLILNDAWNQIEKEALLYCNKLDK